MSSFEKGKKIYDRSGYTLIELLCVIVILVLVSSCLVVGVNLCATTYVKSVNYSRAQTLASTISSLISDELRYAKNIQPKEDGGLTSYSSITQGNNASIEQSGDGKIIIKSDNVKDGACILGESAYPDGFKVNLSTPIPIVYDEDGHALFNVEFQILDSTGNEIKSVEFQVKTVNKVKSS